MPPVKIALAVSLLFVSAAYAQEPSEADKVAALKRAYQLNAVGEISLADPKKKNEIDSLADRVLVPPPVIHASAKRSEDVCARHHMHKVYYGDKWRCRK